MFVHPAFLCTNVRLGLHFVDHQMSFDRTTVVANIKKPESLPASSIGLTDSLEQFLCGQLLQQQKSLRRYKISRL
jgi:hypothetical protein